MYRPVWIYSEDDVLEVEEDADVDDAAEPASEELDDFCVSADFALDLASARESVR